MRLSWICLLTLPLGLGCGSEESLPNAPEPEKPAPTETATQPLLCETNKVFDGSFSTYRYSDEAQEHGWALEPLAGCEEITGSLMIRDTERHDLQILASLKNVGEHLSIHGNDNLTSLDGLSALNSVGGSLNIGWNSRLSRVDALSALTSIGMHFGVSGNRQLRTFSGLEGLDTIGGSLSIIDNDGLRDLTALSSLTAVGENLLIQRNINVETASFAALIEIPGHMQIYANPLLEDLGEFAALEAVGEAVVFSNNALRFLDFPVLTTAGHLSLREPTLHSVRAPRLVEIAEDAHFDGNSMLVELDFEALDYIGGKLLLTDNDTLQSFDLFPSLTVIEGDFTFYAHQHLSRIVGPARLRRIGGDLTIGLVEPLEEITGFDWLQEVGGLSITSNDSLTLVNGFPRLRTIAGPFRLIGNPELAEFTGFDALQTVCFVDLCCNDRLDDRVLSDIFANVAVECPD